jgi:hypothetical protein
MSVKTPVRPLDAVSSLARSGGEEQITTVTRALVCGACTEGQGTTEAAGRLDREPQHEVGDLPAYG